MFNPDSVNTPSDMIGRLLGGAVASLDIPRELREAATSEYHRVGEWLAENHDNGAGWIIFPQGSFLLNTVVLPNGSDEYDIDLVCLRLLTKEETAKAQLKAEVGLALEDYVSANGALPDGPNECEERKRCWTLLYPAPLRFHLDTLPAIPDPETDGLLITDRKLHEWQRSNPKAFARWFQLRSREFIEKRAVLAEAEHIPPEAVPDWRVRTTLQRVVQVLKLHRNHHFANEPELRPASILLTTLAARSYLGERNLFDALLEVVREMPNQVELDDNGIWQVPNPVEPRENFADRWRDRPELAVRFREWREQLEEDLIETSELKGINRVASRLQESFGTEPIEKAAAAFGDEYRQGRRAGVLSVGPASGLISAGSGIPLRDHGFYGGGRRP